ncbi:hypothetical protein PtA15_8A2 [Puccinia triticina]|uniref:Tet-like 2OG-Fe(II) oxygenase domain-containing protein n=1 Tax=Puccinia triticina TaxID=208348 RepID=A0ABY7CSL0_9BASI|nr:uncharacterized protein PtA15_8A2 [Puccinia triticina]WAQ87101.1 hypothetical protein PtA15_8A2 [Puccinia triticina]
MVNDFIPFTHGKVILIDKIKGKVYPVLEFTSMLFTDQYCIFSNQIKGDVVAVIEFKPISELTAKEKDEINRITTFLHQWKQFVYPIAAGRGWGGQMWGIGWRKCMKALELFGRYIKLRMAWAFCYQYFNLAIQSQLVSRILGRMFKSMGDIPFESNRKLMEEHRIPSFASGEFNDWLSEFDCAPHITFTTGRFYNQSHCDKGDASDYAFALFVPTKTSDGTLANPLTEAGASVTPVH